MSKVVVLSKTFTSETEFEHFKKLYDQNTTAFDNRWNLEVKSDASEAQADAPADAPAETPSAEPQVESPADDQAEAAPVEGLPQAA